MGAVFPLAIRWASGPDRSVGRSVGSVYTANTLGSIAGSLAGSFLLVPFLGLAGDREGRRHGEPRRCRLPACAGPWPVDGSPPCPPRGRLPGGCSCLRGTRRSWRAARFSPGGGRPQRPLLRPGPPGLPAERQRAGRGVFGLLRTRDPPSAAERHPVDEGQRQDRCIDRPHRPRQHALRRRSRDDPPSRPKRALCIGLGGGLTLAAMAKHPWNGSTASSSPPRSYAGGPLQRGDRRRPRRPAGEPHRGRRPQRRCSSAATRTTSSSRSRPISGSAGWRTCSRATSSTRPPPPAPGDLLPVGSCLLAIARQPSRRLPHLLRRLPSRQRLGGVPGPRLSPDRLRGASASRTSPASRRG